MKINKYIKEETFSDGRIEYSAYIERIIEKQWFLWHWEKKEIYDLTKSENNFFWEDRAYPFYIGSLYITDVYEKILSIVLKTNFETFNTTSKINIIKL